MGANQSSKGSPRTAKQQLSLQATVAARQSHRSGAGLRRSMGSMLARCKQQRVAAGSEVASKSQPDYYVSVPTRRGPANTYVSMEHKRPTLNQLEQAMAQAALAQAMDTANNNNNGVYGKATSSAGRLYALPMEQMESNSVRDGSFAGGNNLLANGNATQDQQMQSQHNASRSSQRLERQQPIQLQPIQQQRHHPSTPFHLSRAVNTKTSCVLNNSGGCGNGAVAMPNNNIAITSARCAANTNANNHYRSYLAQRELPVDDVENRLGPYHSAGQQQQYLSPAPPLDFHRHSYSYQGSKTLESKKKPPGALASLFQNSPKQQAHTVQLSRRSKSSSGGNTLGQRSAPGSLKRLKPAPLSGQQATYEAMRTIDMYLIRQIARSCMDFEMEQKIELEIRLRELAAQSMLEATSELDVLEVEKSLLTSDQRMNCYAALLEQQRKQLSNPSLSTDSGRGSKSGHHQQVRRSDVIGEPAAAQTGATTGGSPITSYSSLSNSQSPSKLSPVSGESTNSPSSMSSHRSRTGALRLSASHNTLSAKQRAKNKQREQLMQSITSLSNINCNMVVEQRASLSVSELRIPLMWRDVDHFKGRGDYKRYAVFCLLRLDSQIYDTQLISDVDRQMTDVTFDELVVFNEVQRSFELQLEVYSCVYYEQFSLSSTPRKLKEKLTSSVSRAMGRRLAKQTASANYTKELRAYDKSYRFAKIAHATLRLDDAADSVKTYDLVLISPSAHNRLSAGSHQEGASGHTKEAERNTLPLFGHFCCKLLVRPDVFDKTIKSGYLRMALITVPPEVGDDMDAQRKLRTALAASSKMASLSMAQAQLYWGLLRNFALHLWPVDERQLEAALQRGELPQLELPRKPALALPVDRYARLLRVSNSSITLDTERGCFVLGAYSSDAQVADETSHWLRAIEQLIYDSHIWGSVLNHHPPAAPVPVPVAGGRAGESARRSSAVSGSRQQAQSFYQPGSGVLQADL